MRTMYDSVTAANIPTSAQMVAGYVDGRYAWSPADWARFPGAVKVRIAVFASTNDGHVLDVEPGDATPAQAVGWVQRRRAAGVDPTVYCGLSTGGYSWADVRAAFRSAGVPEPHYWVAAYPGNGAQLYAGSVAHQYAGSATSGGHYDLSVVADYWPGVDGVSTATNVLAALPGGIPGAPTGALPTDLTPTQEDDMPTPLIYRRSDGAVMIVTPDGPQVLTLDQWQVWENLLGDKVTPPGMHDMDPGPFAAITASLTLDHTAQIVAGVVAALPVGTAPTAAQIADELAKRLAG